MSGLVVITLMVLGQEEEAPPLFDDPPPYVRREDSSSPPPVSEFPPLLPSLELDRWKENENRQWLRERAGDAFFGLPLFVPQLLLEEFIPRGLAVGPATFLYRDSKDSKKLPVVVFDQALFHETEFLERVQEQSDASSGDSHLLTQSQRHVLQRSLMNGFRASYTIPNVSLESIVEFAQEQGFWAYLVAPAAVGGVVVMKGFDQKISLEDVVQARIRVASVRQWSHGTRSQDGVPAVSAEIRIANLPLAVIFSLDMSNHGMTPQFVGLGTSLDVVGDLLGREENRSLRPNE